MTPKEFVKKAMRTDAGKVYPQDPRLMHAAIGLCTESGELIDALKKAMFYGKELDKTNLKEESGDILWYLALFMDAIGTDFETEMIRVIAKLEARYPEKFTEELAANRDLAAERKVLETKPEKSTPDNYDLSA
jgi:NTP pyrophosphatase (non-canonical NTP hydrolase)